MKGPTRKPSRVVIALALAAVALFFFSRTIDRAGIDRDDGATAMRAYAAWHGFPCFSFAADAPLGGAGRLAFSVPANPFGLPVLGRWLPLAYCPYMGPWTIYTFVPFLAISDRTRAIRAYTLAWAALAPVAVFSAALVVAESLPLAALAGLSSATWPFMCQALLWGCSDSGIIAVTLAMAGLGLLAFASKKRSLRAWYWSCAVIGLGTGFFVHCAAFLIAWALASYWLRDRLKVAWANGRLVAARSAALLLLGNLPLLAANVLWRGVTVRYILGNLALSGDNVRNADYFHNLGLRLEQALLIFGHSRVWFGLLALVAAAQAAAVFLKGKPASLEKEAFVPSLYFGVTLLLSPFTLGTLGPYHIVALFPFALLALAALPRLFPAKKRAGALAAGALFCAALAANAAGVRAFWARAETGDADAMFPRLEALADWLVASNPPEVVLVSPRLGALTLAWLTRDRIRPREWMADPGNEHPGGYAQLDQAVSRGTPAYFVVDQASRDAFQALCARRSRRLELLKDFPNSAQPGKLEVYRLGPLLESKRRS